MLLSNVSKDYWDKYYNLLSEMILYMTSVPYTESISELFCSEYLPICAAVNKNSANLLRYTQNTALQKLAERLMQYCSDTVNSQDRLNLDNTRNCIRDLRLYTRKANAIMCNTFARAENINVINSIDKSYIMQTVTLLKGCESLCRNASGYSISKELYIFIRTNLKTLTSFSNKLVALLH